MRAETLHSGFLRHAVGIQNLVRVNAELGIRSGVGNIFADVALAVTGVHAEGQHFRLAEFEQTRQNGNVVQIENHAAGKSLTDIVIGKEVAAEHHIFTAESDIFRQQDFIHAGGVNSRAFLTQNIHNRRIVAGFHRIKHLEIRIILRKSIIDFAVIPADFLFIIYIKRGAETGSQLFHRNVADRDLISNKFHNSLLLY